jgi:hypothetical protein
MEVKGKLLEVTIPEIGTSKAGKDWIKSLAIIETDGQYPKKIAVELGKEELINKITDLKLGSEVTIKVNIESREFNGRWFTSVKGWSL